jgi:hypothetical protein
MDKQIEEILDPMFKLGYEHSDKDYIEATQALNQLISDITTEAYREGFETGWTARDSAVETSGAKPPSEAIKQRLAQLKAQPLSKQEDEWEDQTWTKQP